jgi:hypothetical protein
LSPEGDSGTNNENLGDLEYIMFENMQPQLIDDYRWSSAENLPDEGRICYWFTLGIRRRQTIYAIGEGGLAAVF